MPYANPIYSPRARNRFTLRKLNLFQTPNIICKWAIRATEINADDLFVLLAAATPWFMTLGVFSVRNVAAAAAAALTTYEIT
jgi:hypothetical protein